MSNNTDNEILNELRELTNDKGNWIQIMKY